MKKEVNESFQVYNASAGSGKTYTLVREYLKIILCTDDIFAFQKVLAVTFTNKAAAEMKTRLLEKLQAYAEGNFQGDDMYDSIAKETGVKDADVRIHSARVLDAILRNYTAFSITTIDSFTHKIIKSFAYDLGLSLNFEVEMDATELLAEAVDLVISKIGVDKELTKALIDFSLEKADDDRAWDITTELNEFSKLLLNEDDITHFKSLSKKSLQDFSKLKNKLKTSIYSVNEQFKRIGQKGLSIIDEVGVEHNDFSYKEVPNFFNKLVKYGRLKTDAINYKGRINKMFIGEAKMYPTKAKADVKFAIDGIFDEMRILYEEAKKLQNETSQSYRIAKLTLKSIIPLAVLNNINSELNSIKEDNDIRLNSEFNHLISENIKNQPAPFIYERIGQRYTHYFIDEMQDTSTLQWQNLIPLIDNALAQEGSDLMLVGDGKQAIYRWRGGRAEQFIGLGTQNDGVNPFMVEKFVKNLDTNYRSYSEIVKFTNSFFQHSANFISNASYKELFITGNKQFENSKKGGCVSIKFIPKETNDDDVDDRYAISVFDKILDLEEKGFQKEEICILVRKKSEGVTIAKYLTQNNIGVVSSETLLLKNSTKVNFIISVLSAIINNSDKKSAFDMLYFLSDHLGIEQCEKHKFIFGLLDKDISEIFTDLCSYQINVVLTKFQQLPLYEKVEYVIRNFKLLSSSDAYVQFFLDVVLEQQQKGIDLEDLLEYWHNKKDKLSISVADSVGKVSIMTIHKSKGLEFPVVIFPCDLDIYKQINPKVWLDELPNDFEGFDRLLLNFNKDFESISDKGASIYKEVREELELDNFNLLYVALTRPIEQLHIITDAEAKNNRYSFVFKSYVDKYSDSENSSYSVFGEEDRLSVREVATVNTQDLEGFISTAIEEHSIELLPSSSRYWDTDQGKAIDYGNRVHEILSKISFEDDVDGVLNIYEKQGMLSFSEKQSFKKIIEKVINHPELCDFYTNKELIVFNERELIKYGKISIPDRLVFDGNKVTVIDYKTGKHSNSYKEQVYDYGLILKEMNFDVVNELLVYLNDEVTVVKV